MTALGLDPSKFSSPTHKNQKNALDEPFEALPKRTERRRVSCFSSFSKSIKQLFFKWNIFKRIKKRITEALFPITDFVWPLFRWVKIKREITLQTYYPGCVIKITHKGKWDIHLTNRDPSKISSEDIREFYGKVLREKIPAAKRLKRGLRIDFRLELVSLENWRDICTGRIQELIENNDSFFESSKIGAFGYLKGATKPGRLQFLEYAKSYPNRFEYIATDKYSKNMKQYLSLLDYKRKFKYVIDLPGHTYSTKIYWMLFLKRPVFYVEPYLKFSWEKRIKPWVHYIPVSRDYSDLIKNHEWAEKNPEKVQKIALNLYDFGMNEMSPSQVQESFIREVQKCI